MQHQITHSPSFSLLKIQLGPQDQLVTESGSMVARSPQVRMHPRLNASSKVGFFGKLAALLIAILRKFLVGESLFVNEISSAQGGDIMLAPTFSGQISHCRLSNQQLLLAPGAFLASSGDIDLRIRWGGLRGLLSRTGLFLIEVTGTGDLFYSSYGGTYEVEVNGSYVVDNGHVVAFDPALDFNIRSAGGGALGFIASGEGLVCEFRGRGKVTLQARNVSALVSWISPLLPP